MSVNVRKRKIYTYSAKNCLKTLGVGGDTDNARENVLTDSSSSSAAVSGKGAQLDADQSQCGFQQRHSWPLNHSFGGLKKKKKKRSWLQSETAQRFCFHTCVFKISAPPITAKGSSHHKTTTFRTRIFTSEQHQALLKEVAAIKHINSHRLSH